MGDTALEFIVRLHGSRLHMRGCCNGTMWVDVEYPTPHVMLLRRGRKTFVRADSLAEGHVLHFKLMEADLLSIKVFGHACSLRVLRGELERRRKLLIERQRRGGPR